MKRINALFRIVPKAFQPPEELKKGICHLYADRLFYVKKGYRFTPKDLAEFLPPESDLRESYTIARFLLAYFGIATERGEKL